MEKEDFEALCEEVKTAAEFCGSLAVMAEAAYSVQAARNGMALENMDETVPLSKRHEESRNLPTLSDPLHITLSRAVDAYKLISDSFLKELTEVLAYLNPEVET